MLSVIRPDFEVVKQERIFQLGKQLIFTHLLSAAFFNP
jgi:hypothetical protein